MAVRGILGGGNDGGGTDNAVDTTKDAGAATGDVHIFATALPHGSTHTASNEWSGFTALSGPDVGNSVLRSYLFAKVMSSGDVTNGTDTCTWTASARLTAAGYTLQDVTLTGTVVVVTSTAGTGTSRTPVAVTTGGTGGDGSLWEVYLFVTTRVVASAAQPTITWSTGFTQDDRNAASSTVPTSANASATFCARKTTTVGPAVTVTPSALTLSDTAVSLVYTIAIRQAGGVGTGAGGSLTWAGTASGTTDRAGDGTGSLTFAGTAAGTTDRAGTGTGTLTFTGSAAGTTDREGSGTGSLDFTGTAAGTTDRSGSGAGTLTWEGSAAGSSVPSGTGEGTLDWVGTAVGTTDHTGTATGSLGYVGAATGTTDRAGSGSGSLAYTGVAAGTTDRSGTGSGLLEWVGTAAGEAPPDVPAEGAGSGLLTWTGVAAGTTDREGAGLGSLTWAGVAFGGADHYGVAVGLLAYVGTAVAGMVAAPTPAERTYRVPAESRTYTVPAETRVVSA